MRQPWATPCLKAATFEVVWPRICRVDAFLLWRAQSLLANLNEPSDRHVTRRVLGQRSYREC